jgi:hypothetical protein
VLRRLTLPSTRDPDRLVRTLSPQAHQPSRDPAAPRASFNQPVRHAGSHRLGRILTDTSHVALLTDLVANQTYPDLVKALTAVRRQAPRATVVILGCPRVMPRTGVPACYPAVPISMGDVRYVTHWEEGLNSAVEKAAVETGARYIDMWPSSADRDLCRPVSQRWIEPFNGPINADPVHPNTAGEAAMAAQTLHQLGIDVRDCHGPQRCR